MDKNNKIVVLGGYGLVGESIVEYLYRNTDSNIIIGGRNKEKASKFTSKFDDNRVTYEIADAMDFNSLNNICKDAFMVINSAGPSTVILDKVAKACLENKCHYIDAGGYDILYDSLTEYNEEILKENLSFIISAGWIPGISGVFPRFIGDTNFDTIDSIEMFYGARGKWSYNSSFDIVWGTINGIPAVWENGRLVKKNLLFSGKKINFPEPVGEQRVVPWFKRELENYAVDKKINYMGLYGGTWDNELLRINIMIKMSKATKNRRKWEKAAKKIQQTSALMCSKRKAHGMLYVTAKGKKSSADKQVDAYFYVDKNYYATGLSAGIAAKFLYDGKISLKGRCFMADAVNPMLFMYELEKHGFKYNMIDKDSGGIN